MVHGLERLTLGDTFWRVATVAAVVGSAFLADLAVRVLLRAWSERRSLRSR